MGTMKRNSTGYGRRVQQMGDPDELVKGYVGVDRQIVMNTTTHRPHFMDGVTPGGHPGALLSDVQFETKAEGGVVRTIVDKLSDTVSVKDFGAKGDGVTDDTVAIQAAFNTGKSVFFPDGSYIVSATLEVPFGNDRRAFFGTCRPNANTKDRQRKGAVVFFSQPDVGVNVRASQTQFLCLGFSGEDTNESTLKAVNFEKEVNTDDVDAYVSLCSFFRVKTAVSVTGRATTATDNLFVSTSVGVHLLWPESGYEYEDEAQTPPFANRGVRVMRNRKHGLGALGSAESALLKNDGDVLRSALICQNMCDVGGTLIRDSKGLENCVVSGNVVDLAGQAAVISSGKVFNTLISGNSFSFRVSKVPNDVATYTYRNLINLSGEIDGLQITGNYLGGFSQHGISISAKPAKGICVANNIFDCTGVTNPELAYRVGVVATSAVDGFSFVNNVFTGDTSNMSAALASSTSGLKGAVITGNLLAGRPLVSSYNVFDGPVRVDNPTTKKVCLGTTDQGGVLNIGNNSENTTAINMVDSGRDTARIRFTSPYEELSLSLYTPSGEGYDPALFTTTESGAACTLGRPSYPFKELFASTPAINTSDSRAKTAISYPDEAVMRAWSRVRTRVFQFKDAVAKKGAEAARLHVGVIAQEVVEAFSAEGLDATRYGLLCYDKWDDEYEDVVVVDTPEVLDNEGRVVTPEKSHVEHRLVMPAGGRYGIRYEEALALECAYLRHRMESPEGRLSALENGAKP